MEREGAAVNRIKQSFDGPTRRSEIDTPRFRYRDALFFFRFVRPVWKMGAAGLVLTVLSTALSSLLPLSSKVLIDFVVMKKDIGGVGGLLSSVHLSYVEEPVKHLLGSLNTVVLAMVVVGAAAGISGILQKYLFLKFQQEAAFNLQTALFDHLLRFPLSFFKKKQTGYLMSRVSDDIYSLQLLFSESVAQLAAKTLYIIFGVLLIFSLSYKLSLILLGLLPLYLLINYFFAGRLRDVSLLERESSARVSEDIQEVISGVETIKAHASEEREGERVSLGMRNVITARVKGMVLSLFSDYAASASFFGVTLVIMWFGIREVMAGTLTVGDYVSFATYVVVLSGALNSLFMFHIFMQPAFASLERLKEIFDIIPETAEPEGKGAAPEPERSMGEIVFDRVSFSYDENCPVLKELSFSAHPGDIIALVGPSGAGKTTLVSLILKFYEPHGGSIYLDGRDFREIPSKWLRQQIGTVSQDIFLFADTIERNIKYGNPLATGEAVVEAAKMAHIHEDIMRLPEKYETEVGERGVKLSAGQRQRISLARAFLRMSPVLIFDEPTSALDPQTESLVKDSIKKLARGRTTFIVAHRLSMVDMADGIMVLNRGEIIESGTHEELMRKGGFYRNLYSERERGRGEFVDNGAC